MPLYPPRNTAIKKRQILDYKIFEFLKLLQKDTSKEKLTDKSEEVRVAMINFVKAKLSLNKSYQSEDIDASNIKLEEKLTTEIENWKSYSFEEIKKFCLNTNRKK